MDKPRMVRVTDPAEVEVIRRENTTGALGLPRGGFVNGECWAYASDMRAYREELARAAGLRAVAPEVQP